MTLPPALAHFFQDLCASSDLAFPQRRFGDPAVLTFPSLASLKIFPYSKAKLARLSLRGEFCRFFFRISLATSFFLLSIPPRICPTRSSEPLLLVSTYSTLFSRPLWYFFPSPGSVFIFHPRTRFYPLKVSSLCLTFRFFLGTTYMFENPAFPSFSVDVSTTYPMYHRKSSVTIHCLPLFISFSEETSPLDSVLLARTSSISSLPSLSLPPSPDSLKALTHMTLRFSLISTLGCAVLVYLLKQPILPFLRKTCYVFMAICFHTIPFLPCYPLIIRESPSFAVCQLVGLARPT